MKKIVELGVSNIMCVLLLFLNLSLSKKSDYSVCLYGIESYNLPLYPRNEKHIVVEEKKIVEFNEKKFTKLLYESLMKLSLVKDSTYGFSCKSAFVFKMGRKTQTIAIGTNCKVKVNGKYYRYDMNINSLILNHLPSEEMNEKVQKILPNDFYCRDLGVPPSK